MKKSWKKLKAKDWQFFVPPARPSVSELALIEEYILDKLNKKKKINIAVMGCTIEYKSLAHKYGLEISLIEYSRDHYRILSKQHATFQGKERLILQDWRDLHINKKFDIVLGDNTLNLLNDNDRIIALKNISKILKKNGVFLPRTFISLPNMPKNWKSILRKIKKCPKTHFYTLTSAYAYAAYLNQETKFTDIDRLLSDLKWLMLNKKVKKHCYQYWFDRMTNDGTGITVPPLAELNSQLMQYFKIIKIDSGNDIYSRYVKIYVLKRK